MGRVLGKVLDGCAQQDRRAEFAGAEWAFLDAKLGDVRAAADALQVAVGDPLGGRAVDPVRLPSWVVRGVGEDGGRTPRGARPRARGSAPV
ncbi:hypothetical protein GCM10023322_68380 [Rugosimonospora acidiphila]|uniref:Uncharacterized protein n=1 Tax=Rugosimonospora acidiphila TaxID=556531 RepID=A0ABP9SJ41_9ACTN